MLQPSFHQFSVLSAPATTGGALGETISDGHPRAAIRHTQVVLVIPIRILKILREEVGGKILLKRRSFRDVKNVVESVVDVVFDNLAAGWRVRMCGSHRPQT